VVPVGDGRSLTYTLRYANRGSATAKAVQVKAKAFGALRFANGSDTAIFNLGDIAAGISGTLQIKGAINSALNGRSAELDITLSDALHGDFDWLWALHPVDGVAPQALTIQDADAYAHPGNNTFSGFVTDPAGVTLVTLDLDGRSVRCPVASPFDGAWRCNVDLGALTGARQVSVRAQATDSYGNRSTFTAPLVLPVDRTPPTVTLAPGVDRFLSDSLIGPSEMQWSGTLQDDQVAASVTICTAVNDPSGCVTTSTLPGTTAQGTWSAGLDTLLAGDGAPVTWLYQVG